MDGDDTFEEFERVAMTGAAALSRAAEIVIRSAQDGKVRATAQTAQAAEDLQRRAEAQSLTAERYYAQPTTEPGWARAASADEVALAWKGAQQWAEVDAGRFGGYAAALTDRVRAEYGFDPHETGSGGGTEPGMPRAGRGPPTRSRRSRRGVGPRPGAG